MNCIKSYGLSLTLIATLGLSGCGSSSDGDSSISDNNTSTLEIATTYNLRDINLRNYSIDTSIVVISADINVTHKLLSNDIVQKVTMIDGINVTPVNTIGKFDDADINNTCYYNENGNEIQNINNTTGVICNMTNTLMAMPTNAKIGDNGIGESFSCSDGTKSTSTWSLVSKDNQVAIKTVEISYDSSNNNDSNTTLYKYITSNGINTNVELTINYSNGNVLIMPKTTITIK